MLAHLKTASPPREGKHVDSLWSLSPLPSGTMNFAVWYNELTGNIFPLKPEIRKGQDNIGLEVALIREIVDMLTRWGA